MESCRHCGYTPGPEDFPLIDDEECDECHFAELSLLEEDET